MKSSDQAWLEWIAVQKDVRRLARQGKYADAVVMVEIYLSRDLSADLRCDALACKASLLEDQGDVEVAKIDMLTALSLVVGGYQKYSIELSLGGLEEKCSAIQNAIRWYLAALETAEADGSISTGAALLSLARLRGEQKLTSLERDLAQRSASRSWKLLRLEGKPEVDKLEQTAQVLIDAQGRPLRPEFNETG